MFKITPRRHELLSVFMMSMAANFMFLGYDVQTMMAESVIHSVSSKHPDRISEYAGYYGQAIHYISFAFFSLFTASLQFYMSSKWMFVIASSIFVFSYLSYFYINSYIFYSAQLIMGFAYAVFNNAEGMYLSEHSTRRTINSNSALETGISHTSLFFGGVLMCILFYFVPHNFDGHFLNFDENIVRVIFLSIMGISTIGVLIFSFLPTKQYDSIALNTERITPSIKKQFKRFGHALGNLNTLLLIFTYCYMGFMVSFMYGIYPTSLSFTEQTAGDVYIIAIYLLSSGCAAFTSTILIRPMIKRLHKYKLIVPMTIHVFAMLSVFVLIYLSVPNTATQKPTENVEVFLTPCRKLSIIIGFLLGLADFTITMSRSVICQIAVPDYRAELFSLTRCYQCLASCLILFISPYLTVELWIIILFIGLFLGTSAIFTVLYRTPTNAIASPIEPLKEVEDFIA